jgi:MFS family permease
MGEATTTAARPDSLSRRRLIGAVVASAVGTTLAWYDLFLYGFAATLVLGRVFFPAGDAFGGQLMALGTLLAGVAARPLGAILLGRLGDRIGRRATLIATLGLMGLATVLVGLVPTYAQIGITAAVLLTFLRLVQGLAAGGEWAASALLAMEWSPAARSRRGFLGSWTQLGAPAGLALAYGALQGSTLWLGTGSYWGWRLPFLLGGLLLAVALYVRLGVSETPVFTRLLEERQIEGAPVLTVIAVQWREVLFTALVRAAQQAPFFLFTTFVLTYATGRLGLRQADVQLFVVIGACASVLAVPAWGFLSDIVGRWRLYLVGAAALLLWSYPYWALLDTRVPLLVAVAIAVALPIHDVLYGPQAAIIAESFTGRVRCTGASLGYQLGSAAADGLTPLIAVALLHGFRSSLPLAILLALSAAIGLGSMLGLTRQSRQDLSVEYDESSQPVPTPVAQA